MHPSFYSKLILGLIILLTHRFETPMAIIPELIFFILIILAQSYLLKKGHTFPLDGFNKIAKWYMILSISCQVVGIVLTAPSVANETFGPLIEVYAKGFDSKPSELLLAFVEVIALMGYIGINWVLTIQTILEYVFIKKIIRCREISLLIVVLVIIAFKLISISY